MKKMMTAMVAVALLVAPAAFAAAEVSVTLDAASAYVFRGVTFNDGPVLQPGLEVALPSGLVLGAWGNIDIDDYDGSLVENQFSEIDIYGSYALPVELLDVSIGYTEYTYPGAEGDADREVGVSFGTALEMVELGLGIYYGLDGGIEKSLYVELSAGTSLELAEGVGLDLGATVGYADPDEGESGFADYSVSAGLGYGVVGASVAYIGQIDDEVLADVVMPTEEIEFSNGYDVEVVGMLSLALAY